MRTGRILKRTVVAGKLFLFLHLFYCVLGEPLRGPGEVYYVCNRFIDDPLFLIPELFGVDKGMEISKTIIFLQIPQKKNGFQIRIPTSALPISTSNFIYKIFFCIFLCYPSTIIFLIGSWSPQ